MPFSPVLWPSLRRSLWSRPTPPGEFQAPETDHRHRNQQPPMAADSNFGNTRQAAPVADGNFDDRYVQPGGAEEEVEIAERIEIPKMAAAGLDPLVIALEQHLGSAQRVADRLLEEPREHLAEEPVAEVVDEF